MAIFKDYSERIDYLKRISSFHFEPFRREELRFDILGHFEGADWLSEVKALEAEATGGAKFGFSHCVAAAGAKHKPNQQFDLNLSEERSYNDEHVFLNRIKAPLLSREKAPLIFKMIDWFGLQEGSVDPRIHIQHPGQVFPVHVDGLMKQRKDDDVSLAMKQRPEDWVRMQVQLQDWVWGHVWALGNGYWSQWRAGEIMYFKWWEVPHATANCSFAPRYSLQVTGLATALTRERLKERGVRLNLKGL
ncbi:MAG: hypothetical protein ACK5P7_02520 [Bdellovibrio sp.]